VHVQQQIHKNKRFGFGADKTARLEYTKGMNTNNLDKNGLGIRIKNPGSIVVPNPSIKIVSKDK